MKIKVWHDPMWSYLLVNAGVTQATVSLTRAEAEALRQSLVPPEAKPSWDSNGDGGECERLSNLSVGHTLTTADMLDIRNFFAAWANELGHSANVFPTPVALTLSAKLAAMNW